VKNAANTLPNYITDKKLAQNVHFMKIYNIIYDYNTTNTLHLISVTNEGVYLLTSSGGWVQL
jgi:hypothetical protein